MMYNHYGSERELPAGAVHFAAAHLAGQAFWVDTMKAVRTAFGVSLDGARVAIEAARERPVRNWAKERLSPSPVHGDGWYFCGDTGAWEDHWVSPPRDQARRSESDWAW